MPPKKIPYRIERTKNRHSRAVYRSGEIVIRLAKNLSRSQEKEHTDELLDRMKKQLVKEAKKKILHPFAPILRGEEKLELHLPSGRSYTFILQPGKKTKVEECANGWLVTIGPRTRRTALHRLLWNTLCHAELDHITALVHEINAQTLNVRISQIRLRFMTSQWGSCSSRGVIMINAALLFAPPELLTYVIIHELAHRKRADHSPQYWNVVESAMPKYREMRKKLRGYRLPAL